MPWCTYEKDFWDDCRSRCYVYCLNHDGHDWEYKEKNSGRKKRVLDDHLEYRIGMDFETSNCYSNSSESLYVYVEEIEILILISHF